MPDLNEILKDKKQYPDAMELQIGAATMTVGQLRAHEEATGQSIQSQLAEVAAQKAELARAQEEVVKVWTDMNANRPAPVSEPQRSQTMNWREDPFFAPVAKDYGTLEGQLKQVNEQYGNVQKAIAAAVKYVADRFIENDYRSLPEDFRKETPLEKAVRSAQEAKYFDAGGLPAINRVYEEWARPRTEERIRKEAYDKARKDVELESRQAAVVSMKPGFVGQTTSQAKAPHKDFSEALATAFNDPEIVAGLAGGR
jgi:hypothetical protein